MKAATTQEARMFFGIFRFGAKEKTFDGDLPLWDYFVKITARSDQEARDLMRANFGTFERVYTEEQFTDAVSGFYPRGCYCELAPRKEEYYILHGSVLDFAAKNDMTLPPNWQRLIIFCGTAEECCDKIEGDCMISDGERVLFDWLRPVDHLHWKWIPQKFI